MHRSLQFSSSLHNYNDPQGYMLSFSGTFGLRFFHFYLTYPWPCLSALLMRLTMQLKGLTYFRKDDFVVCTSHFKAPQNFIVLEALEAKKKG